MNFISDLIQLFKMIDTNAVKNGKIRIGGPRIKSLSAFSSKSIYYFPMIVDEACTLTETMMSQKVMESSYASFVVSSINLIPFHRISQMDRGSIEQYLKTFHQNMGIDEPMGSSITLESVSKEDLTKLMAIDENALRYATKEIKLLAENVRPIHETFVGPHLTGTMQAVKNLNDKVVNEAMTKSERDKLPDGKFGIPSKREFPLHDEKHINMAKAMFRHCPKGFEKELAENIFKHSEELNMAIKLEGEWAKNLSKETVKYYNDNYNPRTGIHHKNVVTEDVSIDVPGNGQHDINGETKSGSYNKIDNRNLLTPSDQKKANDVIPTYAKATVGFIIEETNEVIQRDVLIGIKTFVHKIPSLEIITNIRDTIMRKRKFLKFIKWFTGESESLGDLILSWKEIKTDVENQSKGNSEWWNALKRRKRLANLTLPFLTTNFCPNMTVVLTMNSVNYLRDEFGIDLFKENHAAMFIKDYFLLGFMVLDQANEVAYIMYDSHNYAFQEYPYMSLEREIQQNDRMVRELYRSMANSR